MFHQQFYFGISGLNIIGHGNTDNNLESLRITLSSKWCRCLEIRCERFSAKMDHTVASHIPSDAVC
jgi:hypothetical protein